MSRYRLQPNRAQGVALLEHCAHARFVWNLACEQQSWWRQGRASAPGWAEQCRQLSEARAEFEWLRAGSVMVQQQAIRDFAQAMVHYIRGSHDHPTWRKARRHEGFRVVAVGPTDVRRLGRKVGEVRVPKVGWVRFRWSRAIPDDVKSYRVTFDRAGRWHVAFATMPDPVPAPHTGDVVGIDRGVSVSAAMSTGELLNVPRLSRTCERRLRLLERKLARARQGSNRRALVKSQVARLKARRTDIRKDWCEKTSTSLARRFDLIRVEDLKIRNMIRSAKGSLQQPGQGVRQKAGLNREILASGWGMLIRRLDDKAPGRVEKVNAAYTSQRCSACGQIAAESRKSQALFACVACGYACNADVNAARNIAAGHAVSARGGVRVAGPLNRESQLLADCA